MRLNVLFFHSYISKPMGKEITNGIEYTYYQCRKCGYIKTVEKYV